MLVIGEEAILKGEIKNCREIEIYGYVEGLLEADKVTVHPEGRLFGTVKADTADVHGQVQGNVRIKQLIAIWRTGSVAGIAASGSSVGWASSRSKARGDSRRIATISAG